MKKENKKFPLKKSMLVAGAIGMMAALPANGPSTEGKEKSTSHEKGNPNKLIHEKSPYLLQHAYNPVQWYPWGEEAIKKARKENKPILLSIGYSTCHWCHVMERESFSDPKIAAIMNRYLVSIKVDREERPDLDKIYITAVSAMTGSAGWPLNVFLTPDLKPFYGGTYFPPDSRWGRPGWPDLVESIGKAWQDPDQHKEIISAADGITGSIKQYLSGPDVGSGVLPDAKWLHKGFEAFESGYDSKSGGFGQAPKFPMPVIHNFLLRYYAFTRGKKGEEAKGKIALEMSLNTLRAMAKGGIYDHIGGGFHRYSTDARWHIPHFEKMLYDNAQLVMSYLDAYQITHDPFFADVARETSDYVLRDMTHPEGGFYSAEDADSLPPELAEDAVDSDHKNKKEGAFYVWEKKEIQNVLGPDISEIFQYRYGVKSDGNAESDPQGEFKGKNIFFLAHSFKETAEKFGKSEKEINRIIEQSKVKLFEYRIKRPRPHLDDKMLTSWNGLMISAFAKAFQVLGDKKYLHAGERAAAFIKQNLYDPEKGQLYRRWREGEKEVTGIADDYTFLIQGLIDLYEASFDPNWLDWAIELTDEQNRRFYDTELGGFFMTATGHDANLLMRVKEDSDDVEPSATSVATMNLLRLAQFTDRQDFDKAAEKTLRLLGPRMKKQPTAFPQTLAALNFALTKKYQIIIAGDPEAPGTQVMLKEVYSRFIPNKIVIVMDDGASQKSMTRHLPFLKSIGQINGKPTAYICLDYTCKLPTNDVSVMIKLLEGKPVP